MNNDDPDYLDKNGNITMCKSCRNVRIITANEKWILDTVLYSFTPDNAVFELCPKCSKK